MNLKAFLLAWALTNSQSAYSSPTSKQDSAQSDACLRFQPFETDQSNLNDGNNKTLRRSIADQRDHYSRNQLEERGLVPESIPVPNNPLLAAGFVLFVALPWTLIGGGAMLGYKMFLEPLGEATMTVVEPLAYAAKEKEKAMADKIRDHQTASQCVKTVNPDSAEVRAAKGYIIPIKKKYTQSGESDNEDTTLKPLMDVMGSRVSRKRLSTLWLLFFKDQSKIPRWKHGKRFRAALERRQGEISISADPDAGLLSTNIMRDYTDNAEVSDDMLKLWPPLAWVDWQNTAQKQAGGLTNVVWPWIMDATTKSALEHQSKTSHFGGHSWREYCSEKTDDCDWVLQTPVGKAIEEFLEMGSGTLKKKAISTVAIEQNTEKDEISGKMESAWALVFSLSA